MSEELKATIKGSDLVMAIADGAIASHSRLAPKKTRNRKPKTMTPDEIIANVRNLPLSEQIEVVKDLKLSIMETIAKQAAIAEAAKDL